MIISGKNERGYTTNNPLLGTQAFSSLIVLTAIQEYIVTDSGNAQPAAGTVHPSCISATEDIDISLLAVKCFDPSNITCP